MPRTKLSARTDAQKCDENRMKGQAEDIMNIHSFAHRINLTAFIKIRLIFFGNDTAAWSTNLRRCRKGERREYLNTSLTSNDNGGAVMRRKQNPKLITGACSPGYKM